MIHLQENLSKTNPAYWNDLPILWFALTFYDLKRLIAPNGYLGTKLGNIDRTDRQPLIGAHAELPSDRDNSSVRLANVLH